MSEQPTVRAADPDEAGRIREIARSSMTTSYALSPDDIETILEEEFAEDALRERMDAAEVGPFVAEVDGVLAGFVEVSSDGGDVATVRWLHVDPERRGAGAGTALFERAVSAIHDRDEEPRAVTLASNTSSGTFFERMEFERVEERTNDIGGRETVEYAYAEAGTEEPASSSERSPETGTAESTERDEVAEELPDEVSTGAGETAYLGDELVKGSEGWFAATFADEDRSEEYGYYCVNCGSTDVSMDSMNRMRCENCGNTFKPGEDYDASYL